MRVVALILLLLATSFGAPAALSAGVKEIAPTASIAWQSYAKPLFGQAATHKKLILLYFKSVTCHWCEKNE